MVNFNQLLADYLLLYGEMVRQNGQDIEFRGIQYSLNSLAQIVRDNDIDALIEAYEDLVEWADEVLIS